MPIANPFDAPAAGEPFVRSPVMAALSALSLLFALACGGGEPVVPSADTASERTIAQGAIVGFAAEKHDAHVWKGLPFARPPVGDLRWRAPQPPEGWDGTREALVSGNECPQYSMLEGGELTGDEDCLYVDVYAPRFAEADVPRGDERRPVMVWIHGGGNSIGSAAIYDASRLAAENDVVVVALQYRLGLLGWLSHPALRATAANAEDASGNFGTLDTIRALEWVRENAAAFGGDPGNVTVFGESAGGIDVLALLLSPRAKGLFHRAISQSGVLLSNTRAEAENFIDAEEPGFSGSSSEVLAAHLVKDGRAKDREAAKPVLAGMSHAEIEAYLRGKSAKELLSVFDGSAMGGMYFVPEVIRDGFVIVDVPPLEALATAGLHNAVPTIVGTNREETKLFSLMGSPYVRTLFGVPVGLKDPEAYDLAGEYGGLSWKAQGADQPAEAMVTGGRNDVYGYRFDWDEEGKLLWLDLGRMLGASHAIEILFVFGFTDLGGWTDNVFADPPTAERLSMQMRSYWAQFARSGNPGRGTSGDLPEWKAWGAGPRAAKYVVFDTSAGGGLRMENAILDTQSFVAKIETDDRFTSTEQRCTTFRDVVTFNTVWSSDDYDRFAGGACRDTPLPPRTPIGM